MKTRILSLMLAFALCVGLVPAASAASDLQPFNSINRNLQNYAANSLSVKSYLYQNPDGGFTRVEHTGGNTVYYYEAGQQKTYVEDHEIVIEDYSSSFQLLSSSKIPMELDIWGGFFAGEDYNFVVVGQENPSQNDNTEVIRVIKYDKNWNRLGQASLKGANTTEPFAASNVRCAEYDGYLFLHTSHEMYKSSDGKNHQANLTFAVQESDMSITDAYYDVSNNAFGYVSHSFNHFILVDQDGKVVTVNHGDGHPRGVAFTRYNADAAEGKFTGGANGSGPWCSYDCLAQFAGSFGYNSTGGSIGGLEETNSGYVVAYNYDGGHSSNSDPRHVYLAYIGKDGTKSEPHQLTTTLGNTTPVLVSTGLNGGYILWNGEDKTDSSGTVYYRPNDTLYYAAYDAEGNAGPIQTATAMLSDCKPIVCGGKLVWYTDYNTVLTFYTLDESGVTSVSMDSPFVPHTIPGQSTTTTPGTTTTTPGTQTGPGHAVPSGGVYMACQVGYSGADHDMVTVILSNCNRRSDFPTVKISDENGPLSKASGTIYNAAYGCEMQKIAAGVYPNLSDSIELYLCTAEFPKQYTASITISSRTVTLKQGDVLNGPINGYNMLAVKSLADSYYFFYLERQDETPASAQTQKPTTTTTPGTTTTTPGTTTTTPGTTTTTPGTTTTTPGTTTTTTKPETPVQTVSFSDVPSSHWAYSYIQNCAGKGIVSGVGDGKFDPDGQVTYAQFCVMLINAFYPEQLDRSVSGAWYAPYTAAARKVGLHTLTNIHFDDDRANDPMDRYNMARMVYNALDVRNISATAAQRSAVQANIKEWDQLQPHQQEAISTCYALNLLSGLGDGSFGGFQNMTRAQACVVLNALEKPFQAKTDPRTMTDFSAEYMSSKYYRQLMDVTLTGDLRKDILAIATSQLGYCEGDREDQLDGSYAGSHNYTEYVHYFGGTSAPWCSEFASWCARMANVPKNVLNDSGGASVKEFAAPYYSWSQTVYAGGSYTPRPGDLVLFAWNGTSMTADYLSHTAIVSEVKTSGDTVIITTIDGNSSNRVRMNTHYVDMADGKISKGHMVYFVAPNYD